MKLHNIYGYGQLFCFSGLEGETSRKEDFVGMLMQDPITIRFHFENLVTLKIPFETAPKFECVLGDTLVAENLAVLFINRNTIVGKSPIKPCVFTEQNSKRTFNGNTEEIDVGFAKFYLTVEKIEELYYFNFSYLTFSDIIYSNDRLNALIKDRYAYFKKMPKCKDKRYERLYYKCLSINKLNVYSPEGNIPCRWTTPDRVPHRFMWLWDSAFHAMAFAEYDIQMAKDCIRSILCMQSESGFIAHMYDPNGALSEITQPQVLAWAVWNIYCKDKDKQFLLECAPALKKFLIWTKENRDNNANGLLEWFTEPNYTECKCGESGLDNSPRFDFEQEADAIDFSIYLLNDSKYMSLIYKELNDEQNAKYFNDIYTQLKDKINTLLWDEEEGLYFDRLFNGQLTKVVAPYAFLPMFAGICSKERAERMVKVLLDKNKFWTEMPIPSMPKDSEFFDIDMWRGCSWLNINYFVIMGLIKYGYNDIASILREKTLASVLKWYKKTGNVFEFYDTDNKICPFYLKRKGLQPEVPDYNVHVHSITDYNWSACFTMLLIQGIILK